MSVISDHVVKHTPRCLAHLDLDGIEVLDEMAVRFRIVGKHGERYGAVLGYSLGVLNKEYDGPLTFMSPLAICWQDSCTTIPLLDTRQHGYHGEIGESTKWVGTDAPAVYECPQCRGTSFGLAVTFFYWDGALDLWEDEPDIAIEDYFNEFSLCGECAACRVIVTISEFYKI